VELKGGPHTALRPWGPGRLTPSQKNNHPYRLQDYFGVRGDLRGRYLRRAHSFSSFVLQNNLQKLRFSVRDKYLQQFWKPKIHKVPWFKFPMRAHTVSRFNSAYNLSSYVHKNHFIFSSMFSSRKWSLTFRFLILRAVILPVLHSRLSNLHCFLISKEYVECTVYETLYYLFFSFFCSFSV
jgi:hypothetical protein